MCVSSYTHKFFSHINQSSLLLLLYSSVFVLCFAFFNPDSFDQIDAYLALFLPFPGSVHFMAASAGATVIL